jgi:hypothetical protein
MRYTTSNLIAVGHQKVQARAVMEQMKTNHPEIILVARHAVHTHHQMPHLRPSGGTNSPIEPAEIVKKIKTKKS